MWKSVPPSKTRHGAGILTCCASTTPFGLVLAPDSPWVDLRCPGNLGFPADGVLTRLFATYANILTTHHSTTTRDVASTRCERSATALSFDKTLNFGMSFKPRYIFGAGQLDQ